MIVKDWADVIGIAALDFIILLLSVSALPNLPEKAHFVFAMCIMIVSCYFLFNIINFIESKFKKKNDTKINQVH